MARHVFVVAVMVGVSLFALPARAQEKTVVQGNTDFGCRLYRRIAEKPGNVFCSPFSISTALAMTAAGARGTTLGQMADVLGLEPLDEAVHGRMGELLADLNSRALKGRWAQDPNAGQKPFELVIANALWGQKNYPFSPEFVAIGGKHYGAGVQALDFKTALEAARKEINGWVEQRTASRIKDLLGPADLTPDVRLVLTNAIYFKAAWDEPFVARATLDAPFHLAGGEKPAVPTMHRTAGLRTLDVGDADVVELPYLGDAASMVLVVPKALDGLAAIEAKLDRATLDGWLGKLDHQMISLWLPRFKYTSRFELSEQLQAMGMVDAFKFPGADFTAMSPTGELYIGFVIHQAYVDVNESGTEAAAATAVGMKAGGAPAQPREIKADRPFLFLIRDAKTGSILFLGRVADPRG